MAVQETQEINILTLHEALNRLAKKDPELARIVELRFFGGLSIDETAEILGFATKLQQKAATSGMFAFPPLIDVKVDQPESQIEIDRDKVAELGLSLETVAQDLATAMGGNFVNRFSVAGRSYKVIPQLTRAERLNPSQLNNI